MLEKFLFSLVDLVVYDLEDFVSLGKKVDVRCLVIELLDVSFGILFFFWSVRVLVMLM